MYRKASYERKFYRDIGLQKIGSESGTTLIEILLKRKTKFII